MNSWCSAKKAYSLGIAIALMAAFGSCVARAATLPAQSRPSRSSPSASAPSGAAFLSVDDARSLAEATLGKKIVHDWDPALSALFRNTSSKPIAYDTVTVFYTMLGPGRQARSQVQYRIYRSSQIAAAHSEPDTGETMMEADEGQFPSAGDITVSHLYSGVDNDKRTGVTHHFRCVSVEMKSKYSFWSRCYYYERGNSNVVIVGTTTSAKKNEAMEITDMGARMWVLARSVAAQAPIF
jgi:hypothetical protein